MAVDIPDSALRAAVLVALSTMGQPVEGEITVENMTAMEQLVILSFAWKNEKDLINRISVKLESPDQIQMGDGIESLEGLQYARNMTCLVILGNATHLSGGKDNTFNDLSPLSGLENLEKLVLEFNNLVDISPISGLKNLTHLELDYNIELKDISAIQELEKLTVLDLRHCYEANFNVLADLTSLEYLYLCGDVNINLLTELTISALYYLWDIMTLDLSFQQINDISVLAGMSKLETLNLFNNNIGDISILSGLQNLRALSIDKDTYNNNKETVEVLEDNGCVVYTESIESLIYSLRK